MPGEIHILKLGGSLLDLPDLAQRLAVVLDACADHRIAIVVGGAEAADIVRRFDAMHQLSETDAHWLAVRAMQLNAHLIAQVLYVADVAKNAQACACIWDAGKIAIIDPLAWLEQDERDGIVIAHRWSFTSDSIAAHVATRLNAHRLTLLKSTSPHDGSNVNDGFTVDDAMARGIVDADFKMASAGITHIDLINLRHASLASGHIDALARCSLRCP